MDMKPTAFFITHFSICHSFLDFLYIGVFAPLLRRVNRLSTTNNILFRG